MVINANTCWANIGKVPGTPARPLTLSGNGNSGLPESESTSGPCTRRRRFQIFFKINTAYRDEELSVALPAKEFWPVNAPMSRVLESLRESQRLSMCFPSVILLVAALHAASDDVIIIDDNRNLR